VLLDDATVDSIPQPLPTDTHYFLKAFDLSDPGYRALYRELTVQPAVIKPPKGAVVALPPDAKSAVNPLSPLPAREVLSDFNATGTSHTVQDSAPDTEVASPQSEVPSEQPPEDKAPGKSGPQPPSANRKGAIITRLLARKMVVSAALLVALGLL